MALALVVVNALTSVATAAPPPVDAPAYVLVEPATGDIVLQRNAEDRRAIASTTKLMTALVAIDRLSLDDVLAQVPYPASTAAESLVGLRTGERMTVRDYLRGLLLASGNDAAETLAVRAGGSVKGFVRLMNERAHKLGLKNTHFTTPVGLDTEGNYSTASDLVAIALILRTHAFFRETTNRPDATVHVRGKHGRDIRVVNRNTLVRSVPFVNGVKTGHTNRAGYCLVGSATRDGVTVLSAVLGTPSEAARDAASLALLRYGLQRYHRVIPVKAGQRFGSVKIRFRGGRRLALVASRTVQRTARRGERLYERVVGVPGEVDGPLAKGARLGTILVRQRGRTVDRIALVAARAVPAATATEKLTDFGQRRRTLLLLAAFVGGSLILVLLRRRSSRRRRPGRRGAEIA